MAVAWGVKEELDPKNAATVKQYIEGLVGSNITLETGQEVAILKGDVKERKDKAMLIFRYQLV